VGGYFCLRAKHISTHKIALLCAQDNLEVKKVSPSEKPLEIADYVFFRIKKIKSQTIRISGALVFLCTGATTCPRIFRFIVDYCFNVLICLKNYQCRKCAKNVEKSAKT
jgi:hypothetical protein